jgi:hypothetical protein
MQAAGSSPQVAFVWIEVAQRLIASSKVKLSLFVEGYYLSGDDCNLNC